MNLPADLFRTVVASTPLVSIDLVVENLAGEILLGERRNRPAQGYWFVPGGRILKDERLDAAFERVTRAELGVPLDRADAALLDVYEHLYDDSVFGDDVSTHYVVLAYRLALDLPLEALPRAQHARFRWWPKDAAAWDELVHQNARAYIKALE